MRKALFMLGLAGLVAVGLLAWPAEEASALVWRDCQRIAEILDVPQDWVFIGHLCVGYPVKEDDTPALERAGWEHRHPPKGVVLYR